MNHKHVPARSLFAVLLIAILPPLMGQTAPAPATEPEPTEETVVLSPFVVESSEDADSYRATATLAGTRIRTDLKDVGSSITVVTQKFLQDTNSNSLEELFVYTPSSEVAGQGGNFLGQGDGSLLTNTNALLNRTNATTRVRGLSEADNTRDFFLSDIPWDSYNVGRVDLQRGPNSVLFGIGSPAGIVNSSLNGAVFSNSVKLENQIGSFGTLRFTGDINRELIADELAVRLSLLSDETKYRQDPTFKKDERVYAALKWSPAFLNKESARTSIRANYENGKIEANDPLTTPPLDAITPWFQQARFGLNWATAGTETAALPLAAAQWVGPAGGRIFDGLVAEANGPTLGKIFPAGVASYPDPSIGLPLALFPPGRNYRGIVTRNQVAGEFSDIGAYKAISLQDASIYDFYNHSLAGPNHGRFQDFEAYNVALSQTFLNDKVGFELAYDHQESRNGYHTYLATDAHAITVDIMRTYSDGTVNPNFGRPFTIGGGGSAQGGWTERDRDVIRLTAFGELNFAEISGQESTLGRILGRHTFTGLVTRDKQDRWSATYKAWHTASDFIPSQGSQISGATRDVTTLNYLGPSLANVSPITPAGQNYTGLKSVVTIPTSTTVTYFNNVTNQWAPIPLNIVNNITAPDRQKTYSNGSKNEDEIDSSAVVWQAHLLDDTIVPMIGIRKDKATNKNAGNAPTVPGVGNGGIVDVYSPSWTVDNPVDVEGTSRTYSVVARLPRSLSDKLPGRLNVSPFYNESENFQPDASRKDLFGSPIPSPTGNTKEYGAIISLFDDKLTLKIAKYKTNVQNATLGDGEFGWQNYFIGAGEAWTQWSAISYRRVRDTGVIDATTTTMFNSTPLTNFGTTSDGHILTWRPGPELAADQSNRAAFDANNNRDHVAQPYSQAEIDETWARENASINAWFEPFNAATNGGQVPANFQGAWGMTDYATRGGTWRTADGIDLTADTKSSGTEFELSFQPMRGLDISMNASKTSAQRTNLAQSYVDWIEGRWEFLQGPAGDMRLWTQNTPNNVVLFDGNNNIRGKYALEVMAAYNLWQALQESDVPELRPWRMNVVANYAFQEGSLKGANVGGSYRWADASVTGFPVLTDAAGVHTYDVTNPYEGKTDSVFDLWVGYNWKIGEKLRWRTQFNVRNVFASKTLLPVTVQPDGSAAAFRIPEPRTWTLTNTLEF